MCIVVRMPKHLIYHEFENSIGGWSVVQIPQEPIDDDSGGATNNAYRHSLARANTEAEARQIATKMVEENPGFEVFICPVSVVMQGTKPQVIEKRITEQGVLPA